MHLPQDSASLVRNSARCPLAALITQEPVELGLEENGDSRQTLRADLPCEVQTAEPTPPKGPKAPNLDLKSLTPDWLNLRLESPGALLPRSQKKPSPPALHLRRKNPQIAILEIYNPWTSHSSLSSPTLLLVSLSVVTVLKRPTPSASLVARLRPRLRLLT